MIQSFLCLHIFDQLMPDQLSISIKLLSGAVQTVIGRLAFHKVLIFDFAELVIGEKRGRNAVVSILKAVHEQRTAADFTAGSFGNVRRRVAENVFFSLDRNVTAGKNAHKQTSGPFAAIAAVAGKQIVRHLFHCQRNGTAQA